MTFKIGNLIVRRDDRVEKPYLIIGKQFGFPKWISFGNWDYSITEQPKIPYYKLLSTNCQIDFLRDQGSKQMSKFYKKIS